MATKVHCKSYLPRYYSMRDLNEDSNSSSWPQFYGDKTLTIGQGYNLFVPRKVMEGYLGYDKNALKQKILEHEAIFKNQVYELHRLYRTQRNMMEEIKKNELCKHRTMMEPSSSSSSSSLHGSQMPSEDARKWQMTGFPLLHSNNGRTSVSGVEIVNSPSSCTNGNNKHTGRFPFHHGCSSKETEGLDSRPSKARKKLFDLQLPDDQYIDTEDEEHIQDGKVSGILSYTPNGVQKVTPDNTKFFVSGDASVSSSCLRRSIGLADLNEPIAVEEVVMAPSNLGETKAVDLSVKPSAGLLGETIYSHNRPLITSSIGREVKERGWLTHVHEAGSSKSNPTSVPQGHPKEKLHIPSQPADVMLNQVCHPPGICPTGHNREDQWRERSHEHSNNNRSEPVVASQISGLYPFSGFSDLWSHPRPSSAKPTSCATQKITSLPTSINCASTSQETFGDKGKVNASSRLNPSLGSDVTSRNGFYHKPLSGSKELCVHLPSNAIDYVNCSKDDNVASDRSTNHGYEKFLKSSTHMDRKPAIDIDLNEVVSKSSSHAANYQQDLNKMDEKCKQTDISTWPWLKPKPSYKNEAATGARSSELSRSLANIQVSSIPLSCKSETVRDLNQKFPPTVVSATSDCDTVTTHETRNIKKILGFPIFEIPSIHKEEPSSRVSTSDIRPPEGKISKSGRRNGIIDINLACESDEQIAAEIIEKEIHTGGTCIRNHIDLNSCISDDEDPPASSVPSNGAITTTSVEIDLEAPVILESKDDIALSRENIQVEASLLSSEHQAEQMQDVVVRNAAQTIIAISSSSQKVLAEDNIFHPPDAFSAGPLLWLVDFISSHADKLESKELRCKNGAPIRNLFEDMDDFEAMTLQLAETKEEDYMPKRFVPEFQKMEEMLPDSLPNRSRRGPARRGRQRRDFQRNILPGLTSLSRHEVTEDLQTFGGLMRATGQPWNWLTRRNSSRNGGARGRRRTVVETTPTIPTPVCNSLNNIEVGLEDRSLTGWGKTTRRPRRQRCPSGNPPTVAIT